MEKWNIFRDKIKYNSLDFFCAIFQLELEIFNLIEEPILTFNPNSYHANC